MKFFEASSDGWHIGGGLDFSLSQRRALRMEFRDIIRDDYPSHFWVLGVGVS